MKWVKYAVLSNNLNGLDSNLHKYDAEYWSKHRISTSDMIQAMADYKNGAVSLPDNGSTAPELGVFRPTLSVPLRRLPV